MGLVYTSGEINSGGHTEGLIIDDNKLIKVLHWPETPEAYQLRPHFFGPIAPFYYTVLNDTIVHGTTPSFQGGKTGCTTFNLLYLKKLLANNGKLLYKHSILFPYYNAENKLAHFFIPAAEVLGYSQSTVYNKTIAALVSRPLPEPQDCSLYFIASLDSDLKKKIEKDLGPGHAYLFCAAEKIFYYLDNRYELPFFARPIYSKVQIQNQNLLGKFLQIFPYEISQAESLKLLTKNLSVEQLGIIHEITFQSLHNTYPIFRGRSTAYLPSLLNNYYRPALR